MVWLVIATTKKISDIVGLLKCQSGQTFFYLKLGDGVGEFQCRVYLIQVRDNLKSFTG